MNQASKLAYAQKRQYPVLMSSESTQIMNEQFNSNHEPTQLIDQNMQIQNHLRNQSVEESKTKSKTVKCLHEGCPASVTIENYRRHYKRRHDKEPSLNEIVLYKLRALRKQPQSAKSPQQATSECIDECCYYTDLSMRNQVKRKRYDLTEVPFNTKRLYMQASPHDQESEINDDTFQIHEIQNYNQKSWKHPVQGLPESQNQAPNQICNPPTEQLVKTHQAIMHQIKKNISDPPTEQGVKADQAEHQVAQDIFNPPTGQTGKEHQALQFLIKITQGKQPNFLVLTSLLHIFDCNNVITLIQRSKDACIMSMMSKVDISVLQKDQLVGYVMAMAAFANTESYSVLRIKLPTCDIELIASAKEELKHKMLKLYPDYTTAAWIADNLERVDSSTFMALQFLKDQGRKNAKEMLQSVSILEQFKNMDEATEQLFGLNCAFNDANLAENYKLCLESSLNSWQDQTPISYDAITKIILSLRKCKDLEKFMQSQVKDWTFMIESDNLGHSAGIDKRSLKDLYNYFLKENGIKKASNVEQWLNNDDQNLNRLLIQAQISPTNLQLVVAISLISSLMLRPKQLWTMPAGCGKSFMMQIAGLLSLVKGPCQNIVFIIPNYHVLRRDQMKFAALWDISFKGQVSFIHEFLEIDAANFDIANTLFIVDECDTLIFKDPAAFFQSILRVRYVACFSATLEGNFSWNLDFLCAHYNLNRIRFNPPNVFVRNSQVNAFLPPDQIVAKIIELLRQQPVLMYGADLQTLLSIQQVEADLEIVRPKLNENDEDHARNTKRLANLDEKTNLNYPLVDVQEEDMMRGVDYRAAKSGIALILCKPFSHSRAKDQALSRVGRNRDACVRYGTLGKPMVLHHLDSAAFALLQNLVEQIKNDQKAALVGKAEKKRSTKKGNL